MYASSNKFTATQVNALTSAIKLKDNALSDSDITCVINYIYSKNPNYTSGKETDVVNELLDAAKTNMKYMKWAKYGAIGLGVLAVAGGGYYAYKHMGKKSEGRPSRS